MTTHARTNDMRGDTDKSVDMRQGRCRPVNDRHIRVRLVPAVDTEIVKEKLCRRHFKVNYDPR
jgi:hypothetical protein